MNHKNACEIYVYDEEKVLRIKEELENEDISSVAQLFKALADENRAKLTFALYKGGELCVCDLANIIGITVANASHHLRTLLKQGIVRYRKEGKLAFYSLNNEQVLQLFVMGFMHTNEVKSHA